MSISVTPLYCRCGRQDVNVSLEQTEGQCRDEHNCGDAACPLEGRFGQNTYRRALQMLVPNLTQGWASKESTQD